MNTESSLSTILFETHDVPFISANARKKTTVIEKLPEILDGIKMTTSKLPTGKSNFDMIMIYQRSYNPFKIELSYS